MNLSGQGELPVVLVVVSFKLVLETYCDFSQWLLTKIVLTTSDYSGKMQRLPSIFPGLPVYFPDFRYIFRSSGIFPGLPVYFRSSGIFPGLPGHFRFLMPLMAFKFWLWLFTPGLKETSVSSCSEAKKISSRNIDIEKKWPENLAPLFFWATGHVDRSCISWYSDTRGKLVKIESKEPPDMTRDTYSM